MMPAYHFYLLTFSTLEFKKLFVVDFVCSFDMTYYPFDVQDCTAEIEVAKESRIVSLVINSLTYIGPSDVMQYVVEKTTGFKKDDRIVFKISLGRRLMSVILTTMLPTIIFTLVTISSNYYAQQHFRTIIPLNLTSLLLSVMLLVGVSARLPQTSYLKMIDVWMIFALMVPFINVLLQGYLDFLHLKLKGNLSDIISY